MILAVVRRHARITQDHRLLAVGGFAGALNRDGVYCDALVSALAKKKNPETFARGLRVQRM